MKIEEIYAIPADGDGWKLLPNGNKLMIGANVQAPDGLDIASIGARARQVVCCQVSNSGPTGLGSYRNVTALCVFFGKS